MSEREPTEGGREGADSGAGTGVPSAMGERAELSERLYRLLTAAHGLAATIAETERIAGRSAEIAVEHRRLGRTNVGSGGGPRRGANGGTHDGSDGADRRAADRLADGRPDRVVAERLVPLAEVARRTGRHPDLLRRWCLEGRLDGVQVGRVWCLPERTIGELGRFQRRHRPPPVGRPE